MKKKFTLKNIVLGLLILLVVCQLIRIDKSNPPLQPEKDFTAVTQAPPQIATLLRQACYDCHSNEVVYPWYTNIAPVSWWIKKHVNDGRRHLNFSTWTDYTAKKTNRKISQCIEQVEEGEMPLTSYTWMHRQAKLSTQQQTELANWFKTLPRLVEQEH